MVKKYTDKFFIDGYLQSNIEFLYKRKSKRWDNLIIIDGDERAGKTTLGTQIAYIYSILNKSKFNINNIFFDPDKMFQYASTHKNDIIFWDEAAMGGLSTEWQNKLQQKLIKMMMVCGKYNHFYIFIIPKFKRLSPYLTIDRSIGLIRIYSPDNLERGYFKLYDKKRKEHLYYLEKQNYFMTKKNYVQANFWGTFANTENKIIDEKQYQKKKDDAIKNMSSTPQDDMWKIRTFKIINYARQNNLDPKEMAKILGISMPTFYQGAKKYGKID